MARLLIALTAFSAVTLAVLIVPLGIAHQRAERDDLTRRVEHDAVAVASIVSDTLRGKAAPSERVNEYLEQYTLRTGARVVVVNASGAAVVDTDSPPAASDTGAGARDFSNRPEIAAALEGQVVSGNRDSTTLGYRLLYVSVPVTSGGAALGAVRVSYPTDELRERIRDYWFALAAIAATVLALASVMGVVIARWLARPINDLAVTAEAMGEGDLSVRADASTGPPEVRKLARQFNDSVVTLERLVLEQQEFVADASHQLRTPLQALRLRLENAEAQVAAGETQPAVATLERATAEVDRLAGLVTALLVLERADHADSSLPVDDVELTTLVDERAASWEELGAQRDVAVVVDADDGVLIRARAVYVEQVLDNLVDNAVTASPAGGTVAVTVRRSTERGAVISIADSGPGMSQEQIDRAFRRFATSTTGFGLGLAIVHRLVAIDGGAIALHQRHVGGLDAVVTYPSA